MCQFLSRNEGLEFFRQVAMLYCSTRTPKLAIAQPSNFGHLHNFRLYFINAKFSISSRNFAYGDYILRKFPNLIFMLFMLCYVMLFIVFSALFKKFKSHSSHISFISDRLHRLQAFVVNKIFFYQICVKVMYQGRYLAGEG